MENQKDTKQMLEIIDRLLEETKRENKKYDAMIISLDFILKTNRQIQLGLWCINSDSDTSNY